MSFHVEEHIDNGKLINYNYYSLYTKRENSSNSEFQFIYQGKENTPNISIIEGPHKKNYISSKFSIFSKIHNIDGVDFDGELVIENIPNTNSNKKLYTCFPIKTDPTIFEDNILDFIIQQTNPNSNVDFNLNDILPINNNAIYFETGNSEVILFTVPIHVKSTFHNFLNKNNIFSDNDYSSEYETIQGKLHSVVHENHEGFDDVEHFSNIEPKHKIQEKLELLNKNFQLVVSNMFSGKIFEFFGQGSPDMEKKRRLNKIIKNKLKDKTPDTWAIKNHLENFVEGMTMEENGDEWMECDNVPIDYSGEIPTYTVNASSKTTDQTSNLLLKTLQIFWILFTVILLYAMVPLMYGFLAVRSIIKINNADISERHGQITGLEMALSFLIVFPAIVLLLYGFNNSKMGLDGNWSFNSQTIINCVVSGGILVFFWFLSCIIIYIKKIQDPNFLGYENGNLRTPYFTFGAKTDLNNGLKHIFTSIVALFK